MSTAPTHPNVDRRINKRTVNIVTEPVVHLIAETQLASEGVLDMARWVAERRPNCVPEEGFRFVTDLLPHDGWDNDAERYVTDAELLTEIAGRQCYASFAEQAGRKTNREYIAHTQAGDIKHASILYHAKFTFFVAGISVRVARDLIRHYVGADRDEEGSPSQESTRFTHHYGFYVLHPKWHGKPKKIERLRTIFQRDYDEYNALVAEEIAEFAAEHGHEPKGLDRKRIYEACATVLDLSAETSLIFTMNAASLAKMFRERCHPAADVEFQRLAWKWRTLIVDHAPNLFPGMSAVPDAMPEAPAA